MLAQILIICLFIFFANLESVGSGPSLAQLISSLQIYWIISYSVYKFVLFYLIASFLCCEPVTNLKCLNWGACVDVAATLIVFEHIKEAMMMLPPLGIL